MYSHLFEIDCSWRNNNSHYSSHTKIDDLIAIKSSKKSQLVVQIIIYNFYDQKREAMSGTLSKEKKRSALNYM